MPPPPPPPPPEPIVLLDTVPADQTTINPASSGVDLVHTAPSGLQFTYVGPCTANGVAIRRSLTDLGSGNDKQLVAHRLPCSFADATSYTVTLNATGDDDQRYRGQLDFSTGLQAQQANPTVLDQVTSSARDVNRMFDRYIEESVIDEIGSWILRALARVTVGKIADLSWRELTARRAAHAVISQRVAYNSRDPAGQSATLTGLVAMPDIAGDPDFQRRDRVVVLSHSTGSTPSSLSVRDGWYVLANLIAGRGYLVIAPDNWGRGGSADDAVDGTEQPETYLMANRVATNTLDMVDAVLSHDDYRAFHESEENADAVVIGYSQGGHSAVAVWLAAQVDGVGMNVRELYSGGAPHNLYSSVHGTLARLNGTCDASPWCRDVHLGTIVPYLTDRILPPLLNYGDVELTREEVFDGDRLAGEFVTGMLDGEPRYDALKTLLQLNSFTNIVELAEAIEADTRIHLYHSPFDRLVPWQNTQDLAELLSPGFDAQFHAEECDGTLYKILSERLRITGLVHSICGMETLDEALQDFRAREVNNAGFDADADAAAGSLQRWLDAAEHDARAAVEDAEAVARFRAANSTDALETLAEVLRETGSKDLERLADQLHGP